MKTGWIVQDLGDAGEDKASDLYTQDAAIKSRRVLLIYQHWNNQPFTFNPFGLRDAPLGTQEDEISEI